MQTTETVPDNLDTIPRTRDVEMLTRTLTWWTILRISLEERLVYRGDFALGTLMRFLPIVTQIFLFKDLLKPS